MIKKVTPKITPEKVVVKANTIVKKFYNKDGILTLSSEFDKKSGKIKKDVFMNPNGTKPIRISKYDSNEHVVLDTFYKADGSPMGSVDYTDINHNLDLMI